MSAQEFRTDPDAPAPLQGVRVLDLGDPLVAYAGKLLADLGADVILIEPPDGCAVRRLPPFYEGVPGIERSLSHWFFNTSKRGVTCNLQSEDGRALFERLAAGVQVVLAPGAEEMDSIDCPYARFQEQNPRLVWASVSGFGDTGPRSDWLAPDIVGVAMSGIMVLAGFPDRAPFMPAGRQGFLAANMQTAQGVLMALRVAERDGIGQVVEVSMQQALSMAQETSMQTWDMQRINRKRVGEVRVLPGIGTYETADGHIYAMVGVPGFGAPWSVLGEWMQQEGMAEDLLEERWQSVIGSINMRTIGALMADPVALEELRQKLAHVDDVLRTFFKAFPKRYLYEEGQKRRLLIGPVNSPKDLAEDVQLQARDWWQQVQHPELGRSFTHPGPPFRLARSPWRLRSRAPLLGEHNVEVWSGELGLKRKQLAALGAAGVL